MDARAHPAHMQQMGLISHIRSASLRTGLVMLVVAAMMFRGAIPVNYMVERGAEDGTIIIRMCGGGDEDRFVRLDFDSGSISDIETDPDQKHGSADNETCPYALTEVFDLPVEKSFQPVGLFGPPLLGGQPVFNLGARALARPPLPPRGPPPLFL